MGLAAFLAGIKLTKAVKKTWHKLLEKTRFYSIIFMLSAVVCRLIFRQFSFCRKTKDFWYLILFFLRCIMNRKQRNKIQLQTRKVACFIINQNKYSPQIGAMELNKMCQICHKTPYFDFFPCFTSSGPVISWQTLL